VSYSDIIEWHKKNRYDILREVAWINNYPRKNTGGFYITKTVLNPKRPCPFLKKENRVGACLIQNVKPVACRDAPMGYSGFKHCKGFKPSDKKTMKSIQNKHDRDFKEAFDKRISLVQILTEARQIIRNG